MSDEFLAPAITLLILVGLFLWVPTLHICKDRCQRLLRGRTRPTPTPTTQREHAPATNRNQAA